MNLNSEPRYPALDRCGLETSQIDWLPGHMYLGLACLASCLGSIRAFLFGRRTSYLPDLGPSRDKVRKCA
eukprot:492224-Alexandrium_andersonii.AAC.1